MAEPEEKASKIAESFSTTPADALSTTPEPAEATFSWTDGTNTIAYLARAAHLDVRSDTGKLLAKMFSVSYLALNGEGKPDVERPVTFAFNGGPGSASVLVNMGGIGPKRVKTDGTNHLGRPTIVEDNPYTLLRESDLVFLDAPGTGWSTLAADADPKKVFGVDGDADAFCRAITSWLEEHDRWGSPVYLFGESYGTVRNAVLMRLLAERGVLLTGVTMLSAIFDWVQTQEGEDLYHLGMTPTMAAAAQFFGRAGQGVDEDAWFDKAMDFTEDVLAPALLRGDRLSPAREAEVAEQLAGFIGLPAEHVRAKHLRIVLDDFRTHILADEDKVCGRLDMRFVSDAPCAVQASSGWLEAEDAADDATCPSWTMAFRTFLKHELGYSGPARYLISNYEDVGKNWVWSHQQPGFEYEASAPNFVYDIGVALRRNPRMKLCILGGRYDAATTWWNVVHDMSILFLSDQLKGRVEYHRYGCGHMAYVDEPTLAQMGADLDAFYEKA